MSKVIEAIEKEQITREIPEFSPGDTLYHQTSGAYFGVIIEYDAQHRFFNGASAAAYLVRQGEGAEPVWYPERDLKRVAAR